MEKKEVNKTSEYLEWIEWREATPLRHSSEHVEFLVSITLLQVGRVNESNLTTRTWAWPAPSGRGVHWGVAVWVWTFTCWKVFKFISLKIIFQCRKVSKELCYMFKRFQKIISIYKLLQSTLVQMIEHLQTLFSTWLRIAC